MFRDQPVATGIADSPALLVKGPVKFEPAACKNSYFQLPNIEIKIAKRHELA